MLELQELHIWLGASPAGAELLDPKLVFYKAGIEIARAEPTLIGSIGDWQLTVKRVALPKVMEADTDLLTLKVWEDGMYDAPPSLVAQAEFGRLVETPKMGAIADLVLVDGAGRDTSLAMSCSYEFFAVDIALGEEKAHEALLSVLVDELDSGPEDPRRTFNFRSGNVYEGKVCLPPPPPPPPALRCPQSNAPGAALAPSCGVESSGRAVHPTGLLRRR